MKALGIILGTVIGLAILFAGTVALVIWAQLHFAAEFFK